LFPNGLVGGWDWWCKKGRFAVLARLKERPPKSVAVEVTNAVVTKGENP